MLLSHPVQFKKRPPRKEVKKFLRGLEKEGIGQRAEWCGASPNLQLPS
jgi:hypothetical protein